MPPNNSKDSPRENTPADKRSHTVLRQAPHLPLEDRRRINLAKRAIDEMVEKAEKQNAPLRKIQSLMINFGVFTDSETGKTSLTAHARADQYGSTTAHVVTETAEEAAITEPAEKTLETV